MAHALRGTCAHTLASSVLCSGPPVVLADGIYQATRGGASAVPAARNVCAGAVAQVHGNQVEITGFQARRNEFEPEYDNAAESIVADLEFKEDDTEARSFFALNRFLTPDA